MGRKMVTLWGMVMYLLLHVPHIEMRVDESDHPAPREGTPRAPSTSIAEQDPTNKYLNMGKCFHMPRSMCPPEGNCMKVGSMSVFCCDLDSSRLKEALASAITENTTYLHVLNATIDELDFSQSMFRRLTSMAFTDGYIDSIFGQIPKHTPIACLNISNNNLTSSKLHSSRPFAYLFNLSVLDASANNLTEFPLSLMHNNRKISVDLSGNRFLPCKHFRIVIKANNSFLITFLNYNNTFCTIEFNYNWFKDVRILRIEHLMKQKEVEASCRNIRPANINCSCVVGLSFIGDDPTIEVSVDCSQRHLTAMPTNLPPNTIQLNVSYNNIKSLQNLNDSTYDQLRFLFVDHNDIVNILDVEGTKFVDNFQVLSIEYNKLKTIHADVLSKRLQFKEPTPIFYMVGNILHCDCNTEKKLKPWLLQNFVNIPGYEELRCETGIPVVELTKDMVCDTPRD